MHGMHVLNSAIAHLSLSPVSEDRAIWELNYARNRVQVEVSFYRKKLTVAKRRYTLRNQFRSASVQGQIGKFNNEVTL